MTEIKITFWRIIITVMLIFLIVSASTIGGYVMGQGGLSKLLKMDQRVKDNSDWLYAVDKKVAEHEANFQGVGE